MTVEIDNSYTLQLPRTKETYEKLRNDLLNLCGTVPLHRRFRALFTLKGLGDNKAVEIIAEGKSYGSKSSNEKENPFEFFLKKKV